MPPSPVRLARLAAERLDLLRTLDSVEARMRAEVRSLHGELGVSELARLAVVTRPSIYAWLRSRG